MKLQYAFFISAWTALSILFVIANPTLVSAENTNNHFASQPQISALVSLAIPPYKWAEEH